ncbi:MAG: cytochrome c oxidase assembly protein [Chloroflexota bacterium]
MLLAHLGGGQGWVLWGLTLDPLLLAALCGVGAAWLLAVGSINAAHPGSPVSLWRSVALLGALLAILLALQSPIDTFADDFFSVHMLQHLLLSFVAAPLLVLAGPMLIVLRVAGASTRRRVALPLLASRAVRLITFPGLTWGLFAAVMWIAHFSPLFELALESEAVHQAEHALFLGSAFLYWLPAIGAEPLPWRLGWSGRLLYLVLGMPLSTVLGMVLVAQTSILYPAYLGAGAAAALADQRLAGAVMWVGGDLISVVLIGVVVAQWIRTERRRVLRRAERRSVRPIPAPEPATTSSSARS